MPLSQAPLALRQYVEDELMRAPLLFDQLAEGTSDSVRQSLPSLTPLLRSAAGELMQALQTQRRRMNEAFVHSLREQTDAELSGRQSRSASAPASPKMMALSLVDEEEVALDVQVSHTIEIVNSVAEHELRELQTFVAALVGDMEMTRDNNPFRAEAYARAVWASSQSLGLSRGHQVRFMQHACNPLSRLLRMAYSASASRLEAQGVEPAAYRTLILPGGSRTRREFGSDVSLSPDLRVMRDSMRGQLDTGADGRRSRHAPLEVPVQAADRRSVELVGRLFEAVLDDPRVRQDIALLISRLQGPATRLAMRDPALFDQDRHPLWRFINRLVYASEMTPDAQDPERLQLLKTVRGAIDQLASETEQTTALYRTAFERLENLLHKRLARRLTAAASQLGALQKLEERLVNGAGTLSTMHGTLDVPQLDTVPAELMEDGSLTRPTALPGEEWLHQLNVGDWVRVFLQGRWLNAQFLWSGDHGEILLFGDGGSDATWAVRRGALLMMHENHLLFDLKQRAIVAAAAQRVQEQMAATATA